MRILLLLVCAFFHASDSDVYSQQPRSQRQLSKKDLDKFKTAKTAHRQKKYDQALKTYCKLLDKYEGNPEIELWVGLAYKDKGQNQVALPHLIKATDSGKTDNDLLYSTIAGIYKVEKNYSLAQEYYKYFLERIDSTSKHYTQAQRLYSQMQFAAFQVKNAVLFEPIALDHNINTLYSEYLPQFTADHSKIYFTRRVKLQEDIYYAEKSEETYSTAIPFEVVNTPDNEGAHAISADGSIMIFTHCDDKTGIGGCDLYITINENGAHLPADREGQFWTKPKNMGSKINTILWESQPSLSGDGNLLFFSSTRDGGYGGKDIWFSVLSKEGTWSSPINAGPEVNTSFDESSPFVHADLKTLYFRSNGHLGMGDFDLFISRQDSAKRWKDVKNLGYPINSEGAEGALTVSLDGTKGYFATDFDGESRRNNLDIYEFELPTNIRPAPCTYIKIQTIDEDSKVPLRSLLEIIDISTREIITRKRANLNGEMLLPIPLRKSMMINVSAEGHVFFSDNILLDTITHGMAPYERTINLSPLSEKNTSDLANKSFVLKNVFFESGTADLKEVSFAEIRKLKKILDDHQIFILKIIGHTDDVGSEADNVNLSHRRAHSVKMALSAMGIKTSRIQTEGKGESQPIADNATEDGRRQNRRTEFKLIMPE